MNVVILGDDISCDELSETNKNINWQRVEDVMSFSKTDADAFFNLSVDACLKDYSAIDKPVFINSVSHILKGRIANSNVIRFNGWNSFIKRDTWEVSGGHTGAPASILNLINKKPVWVPDEPGFISARIIAMIVNEAFYAKGDKISTESEIDIAMKLGTNYPYGPFEWARIIGTKNIYDLLITLYKTDNRYLPAPLLKEEALK